MAALRGGVEDMEAASSSPLINPRTRYPPLINPTTTYPPLINPTTKYPPLVNPGTSQRTTATAAGMGRPILSATANLAQLLPSGTVMIYQMLASSFSNGGKCYSSNWYITMVLLVVLSLSCFFFVLTDTLVHNGKLYYGVATCGRLNVLNLSKAEEEVVFSDILPELENRRLRVQDLVHAILVVLVFLAMALTDVGIQNCFFPNAGEEAQQLFRNLPLGITAFASVLFSVFPTRRTFIGTSHQTTASLASIQTGNN